MSIYLGDTKISGSSVVLIPSFPLLTSVWQDHILNNASWLRSDTFSWQDGSVYTSAYTHLVADIVGITSETETISGTTITFYRATDGHKIVLANQESNASAIFNSTGIAWYYILDMDNTRFKLPRSKWSFVGLRDNVGNYVSESLPNITGSWTWKDTNDSSIIYNVLNVPSDVSGCIKKGATRTAKTMTITSGTYTGYDLNIDASESSSTYQNGAPVQQRATQMYLYFYVGNTVQRQTEIDVGQITEDLNSKVDLPVGKSQSDVDFIIERGGTDALWYEIWKSGRLRQGGYTNGTSTYGIVTVNWLKPFSNSNYTVAATAKISDTWATGTALTEQRGVTDVGACIFDKTTTYITLQSYCPKSFVAEGWMA